MGTAMRSPIAATALVLGLLAVACGASDANGPRRDNGYSLRQRPTVLGSGASEAPPSSPANMPGGGRGYDAPHSKGRP